MIQIQVDNVTRSSDHITAILKTVPVQQPAFLESRYNEWLEQGEPGKLDTICYLEKHDNFKRLLTELKLERRFGLVDPHMLNTILLIVSQ